MKACVLYSGGKDSSFMGVMLKRLGLDVELCTANFGVYDSYIPASLSAKSLGFNHRVLDLDFELLDKTCDMIMEDGFPNDGIKFLHESVVEEISEMYDIIADGTRRDDRTPKLNINQIILDKKSQTTTFKTSLQHLFNSSFFKFPGQSFYSCHICIFINEKIITIPANLPHQIFKSGISQFKVEHDILGIYACR